MPLSSAHAAQAAHEIHAFSTAAEGEPRPPRDAWMHHAPLHEPQSREPTEPLAALGVLSAAAYRHRRDAIRDTWMRYAEVVSGAILTRFVIASRRDNGTWSDDVQCTQCTLTQCCAMRACVRACLCV
jgi:hypothetical protein